MRKVKFNPNAIVQKYYIPPNLTIGKVYDVISYNRNGNKEYDTLEIIDDNNVISSYYTLDALGAEVFDDVTAEYRDGIIDEILE